MLHAHVNPPLASPLRWRPVGGGGYEQRTDRLRPVSRRRRGQVGVRAIVAVVIVIVAAYFILAGSGGGYAPPSGTYAPATNAPATGAPGTVPPAPKYP